MKLHLSVLEKTWMEDKGEKDDKSETTDKDEKGWTEPI